MEHAPIALITGGSRGLGRAMALQLADRGTDVVLTYRTAVDEAHAVVAAIEAKGRVAVALPLELTASSGFTAFADTLAGELAQRWDRRSFDFLVNNAGSGGYAPFAETTEAQFDEQLDIHLRSVFFLTQKLLPLIADGGRIVNVSTGITRYTYAGFSSYAIMKGAVEVLTRYLAKELGPRRITANVVAPGGIDTDFGGGAMRDPAMHAMVAAETALGRMGTADDVGGVVAALLAPGTGWINGQRIEVTGGFSL